MRAIVTGAKGFIGKALVRALISDSHTVAEINRVNTSGLFSNLNLNSKQDVQKVAAGIHEFRPDIVFHLASNTSIQASWENPFEFISTNIKIAENLLETIELSGTKPVLMLLSSSAVYDDSESKIPETFRLAPNSPYAISKLAIETIALRYENSIIVRPFFTIGAGRRGDIVDEWLTEINRIRSSGLPGILKVGDLTLGRDYLDVDESAKLLIQIAETGTCSEIYNLCSGIHNTLQQLCETLILITGSSSAIKIQSSVTRKASIRQTVVGDASKLIKLGLMPSFNLVETIKKVVDSQNK